MAPVVTRVVEMSSPVGVSPSSGSYGFSGSAGFWAAAWETVTDCERLPDVIEKVAERGSYVSFFATRKVKVMLYLL